jgi:hypothetical protein
MATKLQLTSSFEHIGQAVLGEGIQGGVETAGRQKIQNWSSLQMNQVHMRTFISALSD